jgi:hypothetical protein
MFGNKGDFMEGNRTQGWLDILGRLASEPLGALEDIASKPHLVSGAMVASLTLLGGVLAGPLPWEAGLLPLGHRFLSAFWGGLLAWVGPVVVLHLISKMFHKKGSLASVLAVTGWASVALWPALAFRLLGAGSGFLSLLTTGAVFLFYLLSYGMWWWGFQRVYGWSKGQALALLPVCFLVFSGFSLVLRLASGVVTFVRSVFPFPS